MIRWLGDIVPYVMVRALVAILGVLPQHFRVTLFAALFRISFVLIPRLRRTMEQNLKLAFPDKDAAWRKDIIRKNATEMGRLLADTVRLPSLTPEWVAAHVDIPAFDHYQKRIEEDRSRGLVIATGHLGSFELLGHVVGLRGYPVAAVARKFQSRRLDAWWTGLREVRGNRVIDRRGAFKEVVAAVSSGMSAAILFDQNLTRNHAVFVDWFGVPAATTKSVALAALRTGAPLFVVSLRYCGADRYSMDAVECNYSDVKHDATLSSDRKVCIITQRLSDAYCELIRAFPEGWFWFHRRWKTRPDPTGANIYS